jgi:MFS transporter, FHS family, L-fucose permease
MRFIKPRIVLLIYFSGVLAFTAASITQRNNIGIAMLLCALFCESIAFATILALGIRGTGRHTKRASGFTVAGVSGGAAVRHDLFFSPLSYFSKCI